MSVIVGSRHVVIPATGLRVSAPRSAAAAPPGWWVVAGKTCVAAYQPKGAASLAASYTNLAQPGTYDAAPGVAPTWAAGTGWTFNGSTQYLTTGITPAGDKSWSYLIRHSGKTNAGFQGTGAASWFGVLFDAEGNYYEHVGELYKTPYMAEGVCGFAGVTAYRDGVAETGSIGGTTASFGQFYIGSMGLTFWQTGNILALVLWSSVLTAGEMATVSAAMAAL